MAIDLVSAEANMADIDVVSHIAYNIDVASFRVYHEATAHPMMGEVFNLMEKTYG